MSKTQKAKLKKKKNALVKSLKEKLDEAEEISTELSTEIASSWMEITDVDGSGTIDMEELKELVTKLEYTMTDDAIKEIFDREDANADGELSKEEFGNAIYSVLRSNKDDAADEENA
jgi:Ca2+-binding EF-hand superfamily protein